MLKPIHVRSKSGNDYLYDVLDNRFVYLSNKISKYIIDFDEITKNRVIKSVEYMPLTPFLDKYNRYNHLVKLLPNPKIEDFNLGHHFSLSQIILKVTDRCNFHCSYCCFSESCDNDFAACDPPDMSFSIATKTIDYLIRIRNSSPIMRRDDKIRIGFYGGEPLLNRPLIFDIVNYIDKRYSDKNISFSVTTNLSLLNDSVLNFLYRHNFRLLISLDGPENEHNKCRVDKLGNGTFEKVYNNVQRIIRQYPKYFKERVRFCCVYTNYHDIEKIGDFFDRNKWCNQLIIDQAIKTNDEFSAKMDKRNLRIIADNQEKIRTIGKQFIMSFINRRHFSPFADKICASSFDSYSSRINKNFHEILDSYQNGSVLPCFPGETKIFVIPDGSFHICEKINNHFPIGDYISGINRESVNRICSSYYESVIKKCLTCCAINSCRYCFASNSIRDEFIVGKECEEKRKKLPFILSDYVTLMEEDRLIFRKYEKWKANISI